MTMKADPRPVNVYPSEVDWSTFDDDELELIEFGVQLLSQFAKDRKNRPRVSEIKTLFLDEFDGFEDVTPAQAVAITEKLQEQWDAAHGKTAEDAPAKDTYSASVAKALAPNVPEDLREHVIAAAKKLDAYVGRNDEGEFMPLDGVDEDELFDREWAKKDVMSEAEGYGYFHKLSCIDEMAEADVEEKVRTILLWYADDFHAGLYRGHDLVRLFERTHEGDPIGIGTPAHAARTAIGLVMEDCGIAKHTVEVLSLSNAKSGEGLVMSVAWNDGEGLHNVLGYGYGRIIDDENSQTPRQA